MFLLGSIWWFGMGWGPLPPVLAMLVAFVAIAICLLVIPPSDTWLPRLGICLGASCVFVVFITQEWTLALSGLLAAVTLIFLAALVGVRLYAAAQGHVLAGALILASTVNALVGLWQWSWPWRSGVDDAAVPVFGLLSQRNQFATLMSIGLAALLASSIGQGNVRWKVVLRISSISLLSAANAVSQSRTGLLGQAFVLSAICFLPDPSPHKWNAIWMIVSYAAASFLDQYFGTNQSHRGAVARVVLETFDCHSRTVIWSDVLHLITQRPLLGWGWGNLDFAHVLYSDDTRRFCELLDNAHNLPLHLAAEVGLPFSVLLFGVTLAELFRTAKKLKTTSMTWLSCVIIVLIGVHSLLEYPLWYAPFQVTVGLAIGSLTQAISSQTANFNGTSAQSNRLSSVLLALLVIFGTLYAGWDYWRVSQVFLKPQDRAEHYRANPIDSARDSWLFRDVAEFALLTTTTLTLENAEQMQKLAERQLHYSPEPAVIEVLIASHDLLNETDAAQRLCEKYRNAFPTQFDKWNAKRAKRTSDRSETQSVEWSACG